MRLAHANACVRTSSKLIMIVQNDTDVACLKVVVALSFLNFLCTTEDARKEKNSGENEEEKEGEKLIRAARDSAFVCI